METLLLVLDLIGTFVFCAERRDGGGQKPPRSVRGSGLVVCGGQCRSITRDVLLGAVPPVAGRRCLNRIAAQPFSAYRAGEASAAAVTWHQCRMSTTGV